MTGTAVVLFTRDLRAHDDLALSAARHERVGIGADTRPNRRFNPQRQARLHGAEGAHVRRWTPELALGYELSRYMPIAW